MDTKNGVLELWSNGGTRNEVKEYRSPGVIDPLCGAGPEAGAPGRALESGRGGNRWVWGRVRPGKGGWNVEKQTGFEGLTPASTHLEPDDPTQVVDFPRMYSVGVFLEAMKCAAADGTIRKSRGMESFGADAVTLLANPYLRLDRPLIREFVRLYANIFANFEKSIFFGVVAIMHGHTTGGGKMVEGCWLRAEAKPPRSGQEVNAGLRTRYLVCGKITGERQNLPACQGGRWFV